MLFVIDGDKPIYQLYTSSSKQQLTTLLCVHSVLDTVDYLQSQKKEYYLGIVNSEDPLIVSYNTATNLRILLVLPLTRKDFTRDIEQKVKSLFTRVNECLTSAIMNPMYTIHSEITSASFDTRVRDAMSRRLGTIIQRK